MMSYNTYKRHGTMFHVTLKCTCYISIVISSQVVSWALLGFRRNNNSLDFVVISKY